MEAGHPKPPEPPYVGGLPANDAALPADAPASASLLGFRVGGLGFLLPISLHCEVIEPLPVNPIPKVEPWFSGLLNIRGNIVPVIDLHLLPGETAAPAKKRYLLAIGRGEKTMALWIDGYPQMLADMTAPLPALPALPQQLMPCVRNAYAYQGQTWLKVQFEPLFKTLGIRQTHKEEATL
ncbi:MAG: chemotaxis protein CheW [Methylovulum miyakonense]|uniref:chemotaxis protein CheW n=1 Tax=Methylovulum miyakonense TaxID=645578 RepID=UPI003BB6C269